MRKRTHCPAARRASSLKLIEFRIESFNGVTAGPYYSRRVAQAAADRVNAEAPEQRWTVKLESDYPK